MSSDAELLEAWRAGDRQAGQELFERHFDAVARFFRNKVDRGIEDLVQRTFLACVESKDRFRGESSFRTFLFAIAHNLLRRHYRDERRHGAPIDFAITSVHDLAAPSPSLVLGQRREERLLLEALRRIPLEHQVALELFYWEKLTAAEVASVVGVPEGTAKSRIRRAKRLVVEAIAALSENQALFESTTANLERWAASLRQQLDKDHAPE